MKAGSGPILGEVAMHDGILWVWNGVEWLDLRSQTQKLAEAIAVLADAIAFPDADKAKAARQAKHLIAEARKIIAPGEVA